MLRLRRESKPVLLENKSKWSSGAKKVWMGGDHPVVVQSMTTTDTADVEKTLEQVYGLAAAGCEVVRVTVKDAPDAAGMPAIVARSPVPIVADIHFDHKMALAALEAGVAKLRLNPGNITDPKKTREVVRLALDMGTPIRIGVNMGSLAADLEKQFGHTPEAMVRSALRHVDILEDLGHTDIVISLKAHDVPTTIYAYRLANQMLAERKTPYALHLGVTEAGLPREGTMFPGGRSDRRSAGLLGYSQGPGNPGEGFRHHGLPVVRPGRNRSGGARSLGRGHRQGVHRAGQSSSDGVRRQWPR